MDEQPSITLFLYFSKGGSKTTTELPIISQSTDDRTGKSGRDS